MTDQPSPTSNAPILGVVLAGGQSRRMGGQDKGLMALRGRPMLDRVIDRFLPQVDLLVLNSNTIQTHFSAYDIPLMRDSLPGHLGPLAGILTAMEAAEALNKGIEWIASTPADSPYIPKDMVARLQSVAVTEGCKIISASSGGRCHPVAGLWHLSLRADLHRTLTETDDRRLMGWIKGHDHAEVAWPVAGYDPFFNVNTPDDLKAAEALYDEAQK